MGKKLAYSSARAINGPLPSCAAGAIENFRKNRFSKIAGKEFARSLIELINLEGIETEELPIPFRVEIWYKDGIVQTSVAYFSAKPQEFVQLINIAGGEIYNTVLYLEDNQPVAARIEHNLPGRSDKLEYTFK